MHVKMPSRPNKM